MLTRTHNAKDKFRMIESLDKLFQFHQNALNVRAFRQQLLASNIANADTPGYKARDIDFAAALSAATSGSAVSAVPLRTTSDRHLGGVAGDEPAPVLYRSAQQPSIDGNTVDMDVERNRFAENAVHYDANLTFLNSQIKLMLAALQG
jgi:flagellar basal-body rod protein FlgB